MFCCACYKSPTTKDAFRLSIASLLLTVAAAVIGFRLAAVAGSSLCLVFGLENCVDFLSSAVVLWRFYAVGSIDESLEHKLKAREQRASVAVTFILVLLGVFIFGAALADMARGQEDLDHDELTLALSALSAVVFGILTSLKFRYAKRLDSSSLYKDGLCSLTGTFLAVAVFINTLILEAEPGLWWLDPIAAAFCGGAALAYAVKCIMQYRRGGLPIFTMEFWKTEETKDEDQAPAGSTSVELPPSEVV